MKPKDVATIVAIELIRRSVDFDDRGRVFDLFAIQRQRCHRNGLTLCDCFQEFLAGGEVCWFQQTWNFGREGITTIIERKILACHGQLAFDDRVPIHADERDALRIDFPKELLEMSPLWRFLAPSQFVSVLKDANNSG